MRQTRVSSAPDDKSDSLRYLTFPPMALGDGASLLSGEIAERPPDYLGPDLNPEGLALHPQQLGRDVYALLADPLPRDNGGLLVGTRGALLVDAGINGAVATQIQETVRRITDRPLLYLVNTTYHGDHSFGNAYFPDEVHVVSSRINALSMTDLEREKRMRLGNMRGNVSALADVKVWRRPDITFANFLELDLGDRVVQCWCFGPGNGPGDTVVYDPESAVAWTGNFLGHTGIPPMLLEGGPLPYMESLRRMQDALDVRVLVPGHGPLEHGDRAIGWMIDYLHALDQEVRSGVDSGRQLDEILAMRKLPPIPDDAFPPGAKEKIQERLGDLSRNMDRLNVLSTYRAIQAEAHPSKQQPNSAGQSTLTARAD